jgi:hypothetical protein
VTIYRFGQVTPTQMYILWFIGYRLSMDEATLAIPDEERIKNIVLARKTLHSFTGVDFGYDLSAWHNFLIEQKDHGYTHPYAFRGVKQAVLEAKSDKVRAALISRIRAIEKSSATIPRFGLVTSAQLAMLGLVGYRLSATEAALAIPDEERIDNMVSAYKTLRELTGADFGYDLWEWHRFLIEHDNYNYTYPHAFERLEQAVRGMRSDETRESLIARIRVHGDV